MRSGGDFWSPKFLDRESYEFWLSSEFFGGERIFWSFFSTSGPPVPDSPQYPHFQVFRSVLQASIPPGPLLTDPTSSVLKSYVQYQSYRFSTADFSGSSLTQFLLTSWSETHSLIFFWSGYFDSGWLLPLWTQYLSRTVLGVAAPLAVPEDLLPCWSNKSDFF